MCFTSFISWGQLSEKVCSTTTALTAKPVEYLHQALLDLSLIEIAEGGVLNAVRWVQSQRVIGRKGGVPGCHQLSEQRVRARHQPSSCQVPTIRMALCLWACPCWQQTFPALTEEEEESYSHPGTDGTSSQGSWALTFSPPRKRFCLFFWRRAGGEEIWRGFMGKKSLESGFLTDFQQDKNMTNFHHL